VLFFCLFFCRQVEEEASDKDNKNCSNNGEQQVFSFCPKYKANSLQNTDDKTPTLNVKRILSNANDKVICIQ